MTSINSGDSVNFNYLFSTIGLTTGKHLLYVRTKDSDSRWALSEGRAITIVTSINAAEYFYDTDPGVGNATSILSSFNADSVSFNYLFPTNQLLLGIHALYLRTRDSDGKWSLTEPRPITITADSAIIVKLYLEGFYNSGTHALVASFNPISEPAICDPITISLASSVAPYNIIYSQSTYLMTDGNATIVLPSGTTGNSYYISVKHRNALETWSKLPVIIQPITSFNFTR